MPTVLDWDLKTKVLNVILGTIVQSENRNDLWKLSDEIAQNVAAFVQQRDAKVQASPADLTHEKRQRVDLAAKLAINGLSEKHASPKTTGGADVSSGADFSNSFDNTTRKTTLPEENSNKTPADFNPAVPAVAISGKLDDYLSKHDGEPLPITGNDPISTEARGALSKILKKNAEIRECSKMEPAENRKCAKNAHVLDDLESPGGYFPPAGDGPVWMSESVNLAEYWVYDYSNPCTTRHGKTGNPAAQTEIWLVHRRKYKLVVIDVEFDSLESLHDFLDPRKELARENKITPLEKIDEELAGKEEKLRNKCRAARKQSQFNRFVEFYHQFNGDAAKISAAMGIQKQSVYAYKNKAKDMGLLK